MILQFDFHSIQSDLCELTKKSRGLYRPHFTCLVDSFFRHHRNKPLRLLILGDKDPNHLLAWLDYFPKSDVEITPTAETFYDIVFIESKEEADKGFSYLKPGGVMIVWNSPNFQPPTESNFLNIVVNHQDVLEKGSVWWVRRPGNDLFPSPNRLTLVTPSCRPTNIRKMMTNIQFKWIRQWIIVYDAKKVRLRPMFPNNPKIREFLHIGKGKSGNPQRNFALDVLARTAGVSFLYFLDDDNMIHPDLFLIIPFLRDHTIYTFNQENRLKGDCIKIGHIDTAMFLVDFRSVSKQRWSPDVYAADGIYIENCFKKNPKNWVFIDNDLSTYNRLPL